jgi:hypothetical protein
MLTKNVVAILSQETTSKLLYHAGGRVRAVFSSVSTRKAEESEGKPWYSADSSTCPLSHVFVRQKNLNRNLYFVTKV